MGLTNEQKRGVGLQHIKYLTDEDLINEIKQRGYKVAGMTIKKLNEELKKSKEVSE